MTKNRNASAVQQYLFLTPVILLSYRILECLMLISCLQNIMKVSMLEVQGLFQRRSRRRAFLDSSTRLFVSTGGLTILLVLMLIFVYLLWVVAPIFKPFKSKKPDNGLLKNLPHTI